jgi:aminopeptidase N
MKIRPLLIGLAGASLLCGAATLSAQQARPAPRPPDPNIGAYGPYRANNDLLSYDLDVRVDPEKQTIAGTNTIRFKMLEDGSRIQIDLADDLAVERISSGPAELKYTREGDAVFIDFPGTLEKGSLQTIDFRYSGNLAERKRFGGVSFRKDPAGRPWITTSCQGPGAMVWWPNKEQRRDEVESMRLHVAVPNDLVDVSNGRFEGKTDLGDGYTRWDWLISYPINNYCVALNIGSYVHFSDRLNDLTLDFYCLPESLEKARIQFAQAKPMIAIFEKRFGPYPFRKDGYKLIEVPYAGMEHQSAVAYGNRFANGYLERDWTGVGISPKFDFIIIHESAHEWFGNSITAADVCDEWIHEGWGTYLEAVYVEDMFGREDALKYINGYKPKVQNKEPIVGTEGLNRRPPQDQYFKGALFINTLRSVVDDDKKWWKLMRSFYDRFKYMNITTEDVVRFFNKETGRDLGPIFDQYLRHPALPALELRFPEAGGSVSYRWKADVKEFAMPVKVGRKDRWQTIRPTTEWATMKTDLGKNDFEAATDLYYIDVVKD